MLKKRLCASILIKNGLAVQGIVFKKYLPIGQPEIVVSYLNRWGIDEIVVLDVGATLEHREPDYALIRRVAKKCFVPLTVGGGVNNLATIRKLIKNGADKVLINSFAFQNIKIITEGALSFGRQSIVASLDVKNEGGHYHLYSNAGKQKEVIGLEEWLKKITLAGAGEILLTTIERDGSQQGFDLNLYQQVDKYINIPIIARGGAGKAKHFAEVFKLTNVSAACAGNYFNFYEQSVIATKAYLLKQGINIRHDTYFHYNDFSIDDTGRILKQNDLYLSKIRFKHFSEEKI